MDYTIIDDLPAVTISDSKLETEAAAEAQMLLDERQMCMVGPTKCSIDAVLVIKRLYWPNRSHKFNRARKGVR